MRNLVAFRVDGFAAIGAGHVFRCLALADALRGYGAHCVFFCLDPAPWLEAKIVAGGHAVVHLGGTDAGLASVADLAGRFDAGWEIDAEQTRAAIARMGEPPRWLVVDHYEIDDRWERALRSEVGGILVIDDLADREHDCDVLLDQGLHGAPETRYADKVGVACRKLLGPRYALLRAEFAVARESAAARAAEPRRLLVFMGGADSVNATRTVLDAVRALGRPDLHVDVVVTASNPHVAGLKSEFGHMVNVTFSLDVDDMACRLALADIAVGAGGGAMLERACLGLPSLTISIAANQEPGAETLALRGVTIYLGRACDVNAGCIRDTLSALLGSKWLRLSMSHRGAELVDGRGARRVARLMMAGALHLRPAVAGDRDNLFHWRNHEDNRRHSGDGRPIARPAHDAWFSATLAGGARKLLIAEEDGVPVGVLRYDIAGVTATVSIYLVPGNGGRGFGEAMLAAGERWLSRACPEVRELEAAVRPDNVPSMSLFGAAGFESCSTLFRKKVNAHA